MVNKFRNASEEDSEKAIADSQASIADDFNAKAGDSALKRQQEEEQVLQKLEKARQEQEEQTAAQRAADERLKVQCMLVDYMKQLSDINYVNRNIYKDILIDNLPAENQIASNFLNDNKIVPMCGDTNDFSSYVNGSDVKGRFLDFTTQQISSLVPVIKLYKVMQIDDNNTCDYLIPFSTHAAWREGKTTFGSVEDIFNEGFDRPSDVGIKSFNWVFEGSNPVSGRRDISAKLVLFSTNLENLVRQFNIYPVVKLDNAKPFNCFKYVDLALRSGKKFDEDQQFNPQYYTIKIHISWKTTNRTLFNDDEIKALEANSVTLLLTLIDHQFSFEQDGSVTFTLDYRAYFEGVLFTESADFIRTGEQEQKIKKKRKEIEALSQKVQDQKAEDEEQTPNDQKTSSERQLDEEYKKYDEIVSEVNKESFQSILNELEKQKKIFVIGVDTANYYSYKRGVASSNNGLILNIPTDTTTSVVDKAVETAKQATNESSDIDPNQKLSNLVPASEDEQGIRYFSYFYLGDLIQYAIYSAYKKMENTPNKPKFIIGSALYRKPSKILDIERVNIMDIPISVEWFTEWFTMNIISQNRTELPLLYFIRDLCSKLINNIVSSRCDTSGQLKLKNKFNISNFTIKKESGIDPLFDKSVNSSSDLQVEEIKDIASQYAINIDQKFVDTTNTIQYISIYCHDISSPVNVNCDEDLKNGIYHFYFGRDRGLVKTINFSRTQVTGLRELNYVRESSGRGLQQLMTPYDVDIKMFGNNLFINGMMIFINPSGFGRNVGQPNEVGSVSYSLKLGGYHTIYRIESTITPNDFSTTLKARWVGSGTEKVVQTDSQPTIPTNSRQSDSVATTGNTTQTNDSQSICEAPNYDSGFSYPVNAAKPKKFIGVAIKGTDTPLPPRPSGT